VKYVSLHSHSTFSYGDGYGTVAEHVSRVAELGMSAVALTEHGNCSSWIQLEKACKTKGIKPIFGLEAYTSKPGERRKCHMILLARNEIGFRNLNRIITQSYKDFYQFPTVHWKYLKEYNEGITVLSGCSDSELSCVLLGGKSYGEKTLELPDGNLQRAIRGVEEYQKVFGDRYFLECQRFPGLSRSCALNPLLAEISRRTGVPLVATSDVHYCRPEDNAMQRILHASHRGGTVESADASWEYDILLTYPQSDEEILKDLIDTGLSKDAATQAISNTALIADDCNVTLPKATPPKYVASEGDWEPWT
jgi:DNA polymerase III subunit alpha